MSGPARSPSAIGTKQCRAAIVSRRLRQSTTGWADSSPAAAQRIEQYTADQVCRLTAERAASASPAAAAVSARLMISTAACSALESVGTGMVQAEPGAPAAPSACPGVEGARSISQRCATVCAGTSATLAFGEAPSQSSAAAASWSMAAASSARVAAAAAASGVAAAWNTISVSAASSPTVLHRGSRAGNCSTGVKSPPPSDGTSA